MTPSLKNLLVYLSAVHFRFLPPSLAFTTQRSFSIVVHQLRMACVLQNYGSVTDPNGLCITYLPTHLCLLVVSITLTVRQPMTRHYTR